jgi:hypothetical protein
MHPIFESYLTNLTELYGDYEKAIAGLPPEALDWVPGPDMNSFCVLIVHVTGATRYLVGEVAAGIPANRNREAEFQARGLSEAELKQCLADSLTFVRGIFENWTPDDLAKPVYWGREKREVPAALTVLRAFQHTGLHLGHAQITRQLWDQRQAGK